MLSSSNLKAPEWAVLCCRQLIGAVAVLLLCSIAYCYMLASLEGAETNLVLSAFWALSDWGLWLLLIPVLVQQIAANQGLELSNTKQLSLALQATVWMPLAALGLRCGVEWVMTETAALQLLTLACKRAPVYLAVWLLLLASVFWKKHRHGATTMQPQSTSAQNSVGPTRTLVVHSSQGEHVVRLDEIQYLKACGNYMEVKVQDSLYLMRATMKALETVLAGSALVRCHRSFFVNLSYVLSIDYAATGNHDIVLNSGEKIPVSKSFRDQFRTQYRQSGGVARTS